MLLLCSIAPHCYPVLVLLVVTPYLSVSSFLSLSLLTFSLSYEQIQSLIFNCCTTYTLHINARDLLYDAGPINIGMPPHFQPRHKDAKRAMITLI